MEKKLAMIKAMPTYKKVLHNNFHHGELISGMWNVTILSQTLLSVRGNSQLEN